MPSSNETKIRILEEQLSKFKVALESIRILADRFANDCEESDGKNQYGFRLIESKAEKAMYE